jgi:hypothetical protein
MMQIAWLLFRSSRGGRRLLTLLAAAFALCLPSTALASAPWCDLSAQSVEAPLPKRDTDGGAITAGSKACDAELDAWRSRTSPDDRRPNPRRSADLGVDRALLPSGIDLLGARSQLLPAPERRHAPARPAHALALERPPRR